MHDSEADFDDAVLSLFCGETQLVERGLCPLLYEGPVVALALQACHSETTIVQNGESSSLLHSA